MPLSGCADMAQKEFVMKKQILFGVLVCSSALLVAQPPPPAPMPAPTSTVTGSISQFNYGPDGRVEGFVVAPNTLVTLPPDWAIQVEMLAKTGNQVRVTGAITPTASGMQIVQPQSVDLAGKTLVVVPPSRPAPYADSGVIRSLNYGRQGEVNGFVFQNGVIARTPPFGASDVSVVKPGASISVSGFARVTPSGRTVVEVQSITANGQTIAMNALRPDGPGRGPKGGKKGPRGVGPPPPPAIAGVPTPPPPPPNR
jgi:hypothetical protein